MVPLAPVSFGLCLVPFHSFQEPHLFMCAKVHSEHECTNLKCEHHLSSHLQGLQESVLVTVHAKVLYLSVCVGFGHGE